MIEKTVIIYILLRIKFRNGKTKIVLAGSVKFTFTKAKKAWKEKKARDIQVIFLKLWLLLTSIVLLPISKSFFFFTC